MMHVIAQTGTKTFLLDVGSGQGRVLDLEQKLLSPPLAIATITASGRWRPYVGDEAEILRYVEEVHDLEPSEDTLFA